MTKNANLFFNVIKLPIDWLMIILAGFTTYILRTKILTVFRPAVFTFDLRLADYIYLVFFVSLLFIGAYAISGLYNLKSRYGLAEEFLKIAVASSAGIMIVIFYIFLSQELFNSRFLVMGGWFFAVVFVFAGRILARLFQRILVVKYDFGARRVAIIGNDGMSDKIISAMTGDSALGYRIIKKFDRPDLTALQTLHQNNPLDRIILASTDYQENQVTEIIDFCNENFIGFKYIPNIHQILTKNFDFNIVGGIPLVELKRTALGGWGDIIKRILDIAASFSAIVILFPFFLIIGGFIKLDSRGPVFVKLKRISRNKEFGLIKFRSMINRAEELKPRLVVFNERQDGPLFKMKNDPRITKIGKVLRKTRIDELPQFWNVLAGDISLVGPRPHQPDEIEKYEKRHRKVLAIKAGATGLAQVSGSSDLPFEQEVALDSFYIENWSLSLDFKIILKTVWKMFNDRSAV